MQRLAAKKQKADLDTDSKRNGYTTKTVKSPYEEFQPKLVPKYQWDISGIEDKVISLYARGLSTRDIHGQL